jgi:diguanylate cyclase (GGDEF)-like protein
MHGGQGDTMDINGVNGTVPQLNLYERLLRKYELMQSVFSIISRKDLSFGQQIDGILQEGCELFDEDIGIVSEIKGSTYIVRHVYTTDGSIQQGQVFEADETFCAITLQKNGPVAVADLRNSEWKHHQCLRTGLRSYVGVPIIVEDRPFGTLNFASRNPKPVPFHEIDIEFVETLGNWVSMILARSIMLDELHILATHDSLTGLPNRKYFQKRLDSCIHRAQRDEDYSFALLFIDLDQFKQVNDRYGHYAGDTLLKEVAARIESHVRPRDNIGRFAGDEFIVLIEDVSGDMVLDIAGRILDSVKQPIRVEDTSVSIDASIGITMSGNAHEARDLIEIADKAMYHAKRRDRGVCLWDGGRKIYR